MPEAEVLYSDIKFKRVRGKTDVATPSTDEPTYSEVKTSKAQRPAELPGSKQPAASNRRSGVTSERVALLVLSVLLTAAVTALGVTLHENTQTKKSLQKSQDEAKNLTVENTQTKKSLQKSLQKLQDEAKNLTVENTQTKKSLQKSLQKLQDEAKNLTEILNKREPCKVEQPCKPPPVRKETCPRCEDGWEPHGGKCYFFSSVTLNWTQSRRQCKSMRGDLVVINSREEQRFLVSKVSEQMETDEVKFWIGLTDSEREGEWLWVDNTRLNESLTFWREGEPNNVKGENPDGEDCVTMWEKDGVTNLKTWFDQSCKSSKKSICEKTESWIRLSSSPQPLSQTEA
ncbi:CD209 antigen-like protein B isoform X1 [Platichthys flesus]|uniref:CD209 antigen-like protein B isoform X1 n=1 Tax=Platichthys flesus TaxID=8260 RepID=UPI002DB67249|nr:CD209 antigen-like protein B isoform X1 [Platichthys flesus]